MYLCPEEDLIAISDAMESDFEKLRGKKIFLTGATGFIGKNLLESIFWINEKNNLNIEVFSISRDPDKFYCQYPHFKLHNCFKLYKCDIRDDLSILPIKKIDYVVHAATDVIKQGDSVETLKTCVDGTSNVLSFSGEVGCKSFLLLSSGAVYGKSKDSAVKFSESDMGGVDLASSKSAYALGKQLSEWLSQQVNSQNFKVKIARCFAFVGPYLPLNQHFAIGNFIEACLKGRNIEINGDGTPLRTYLYTSDLCIWLLKILLSECSSNVFNVGGGEVVSISQLANIVKKEVNHGVEVSVRQVPGLSAEAYVPDLNKIRLELHLSPTVNLNDAIRKTANWNLKYANI